MTEPNIAFVANLLADPSRAAICLSLAGGEVRPAGELAARAGISAQTASNHLAKLIAGRILCVERQGRWRYYRLAGADVGHAVEALAVVAPPLPSLVSSNGTSDSARHLKSARTCYRHLAGRLGVALADALVALLEVVPRQAEVAARRCIDWTERRPHVAGPVGTGLATLALDRGWVRRRRGTRALAVTPLGRTHLHKVFNLRWEERP